MAKTMRACALLILAVHFLGGCQGVAPTCGVFPGTSAYGYVRNISDGKNERCISIIAPKAVKKPMPVLFWFHGGAGNAGHCGVNGGFGPSNDLATSNGFAVVCGEAIQDGNGWRIPEVITDATGTPCGVSDSVEITYIKNAIAELKKDSDTFDTSRIFTMGCSMGSAFSEYISSCIKEDKPEVISAFATHSTGLKVKGDGNKFPKATLDRQYEWGECPDCQYFPFKPRAFNDSLGLKACIFDNSGDPSAADPLYYRSSKAVAEEWRKLGMKTETHFGDGGHCEIHSYQDIVTCLDDGTNRLTPNGPAPPPPPTPSPPPSPAPTPSEPPSACQQCFESNCGSVRSSEDCGQCVQGIQSKCSSSCRPYPFKDALSWFCQTQALTQFV